MGPSAEGRHSPSTDCRKRIPEEVKDNDDLYASTPILCVLRLLLTMSVVNTWKVRAGDISTAFLHAKAATDDLFFSTSRIPQPRRPSSMEAQQRDLRSTQQPTRMAETSSRNTTTAWHGKTSKWTKRVQDNSRQRIHPMLRGRSPIPWGTNSCGRTVSSSTFYYGQQEISQSATPSTSSAETSPTKVIATRSAYWTNTQPTYYTKQAWQTASHHQRREPRLATQTLNSHSTQRNAEHTDGQPANYDGWHTPDRTSATQQRS